MAEQIKQIIFPFDLGIGELPTLLQPRELGEEFILVYNALKILGQQLGGRVACVLEEAVSPGNFISVRNVGGVLTGSLADSPTKIARGIYTGTQNAVSGDSVEIQTSNVCVYPAGNLVPGTLYYLSTTAGDLTSVAPSPRQVVGWAAAADLLVLNFDPLFT